MGLPADARTRWFLAALAMFVGSTFLAFTQAPRPDAYRAPTALSADWFRHPIERNAFQRLPRIDAGLYDVFVVPGSGDVWAAGEGAMLLHSTNGGRSWRQDTSFVASLADNNGNLPTLGAVFFADTQNGWAVGQRGTILYTADGGRSWQVRGAGTSFSLRDVYFVNARQGWAVGDGGTILYTADGGQTWGGQLFDNPDNPGQTSVTRFDFRGVHFWNDRRGWAVGSEGIILYTDDGGQNWRPQNARTQEGLWDVSFVDGQTGYAVGGNTVLKTTDSGQTWQALDAGTGNTFYGVHFFDAQTGLVVGIDTILLTKDGGQSWRRFAVGPGERLLGVHLADSQTGYIVGSFGTLLKTIDGGQSWLSLSNKTNALFYSVHFIDAQNGFVGSNDGTILKTTDGGLSWQPVKANPNLLASLFSEDSQIGFTKATLVFTDARNGFAVGGGRGITGGGFIRDGVVFKTADGGLSWRQQEVNAPTLYGIHFTDAQNGFVVGTGGTIRKTTDAGQSWQPLTPITPSTLYAVHFIDEQIGFAAGSGGTVLKTSDGGQVWQSLSTLTAPGLFEVHFIDEQTGFAVNQSNTIGKTIDGGLSWERLGADNNARLHGVHFTDAQTGFVVGTGGTIRKTTDAGQTWFDPRLYGWWPAPWYYASLLLVLFLLRPALKRPEDQPAPETSVADELISDRPLKPGDPDPLDFGVIARGLSRFLRNQNTQPPLTIAVTGPWGSGKSSLMNLLKGDLARHGFRSVWFNAWHHQTEEHLLAALLENIRKQAVPPWWHPQNWAFRARLLRLRWQRYAPLVFVLLFVFALSLGYFVARPDHLSTALDAVPTSIEDIKAIFGGEADVPGPDAGGTTFLALFFSSLLGLGVLTLRALVAFGVTPAALMSTLKRNARTRDLEAQTSFRYRFAREFGEVTKALRPRTMVIMIDDLDRCRPQNVLTLLEAVNFLVSSGDCYIVLGMEMDRVEQYVAKGFEDIIKQEPDFAKNYLEKLINIEVPVPLPAQDDPKTKALLSRELRVRLDAERAALQRRVRTIERVQRVGRVVVVGAFLAGAFLLARSIAPERPPDAVAPDLVAVTPGARTDTTGTTGTPQGTTPDDTTGTTTQAAKASARYTPGEEAAPPWWLAVLLMAPLLGVGLWRLSIRPGDFENDSPNFAKALEVWYPAIAARSSTPRSLKRFVNRVRYLAMRQRALAPSRSLAERLILRLDGQADASQAGSETKADEAPPPESAPIPEEMLVALSAIHHLNPAWLQDEGFIFGERLDIEGLLPVSPDKEAVRMLKACIHAHEEATGEDDDFVGWPPSEEDRNRLLAILGTIRVY